MEEQKSEEKGVYERLLQKAAESYVATGLIEEGSLMSISCAMVDPRIPLSSKKRNEIMAAWEALSTTDMLHVSNLFGIAKRAMTKALKQEGAK